MNNLPELIEKKLMSYLPDENCLEKDVIRSMSYSLSAGGKRIRPMLVLMFCELCGGSYEQALPFACAVEMVHTYSLIHDDLPCMDNDDMRRGRPSNHKVFGEDIALLAGDALQSLAFEIMTCSETVDLVGEKAVVSAVNVLAKNIGATEMVGGQVIDLQNENTNAGIDILRNMDNKKTGSLIAAACELGCIAAGADKTYVDASSSYGRSMGLAFQIMDDILDVTSSLEELGKPIGSDKSNDKSTYVSVLGIEECENLVNGLTAKAIDYLNIFGDDTAELRNLAISLSERTK